MGTGVPSEGVDVYRRGVGTVRVEQGSGPVE